MAREKSNAAFGINLSDEWSQEGITAFLQANRNVASFFARAFNIDSQAQEALVIKLLSIGNLENDGSSPCFNELQEKIMDSWGYDDARNSYADVFSSLITINPSALQRDFLAMLLSIPVDLDLLNRHPKIVDSFMRLHIALVVQEAVGNNASIAQNLTTLISVFTRFGSEFYKHNSSLSQREELSGFSVLGAAETKDNDFELNQEPVRTRIGWREVYPLEPSNDLKISPEKLRLINSQLRTRPGVTDFDYSPFITGRFRYLQLNPIPEELGMTIERSKVSRILSDDLLKLVADYLFTNQHHAGEFMRSLGLLRVDRNLALMNLEMSGGLSNITDANLEFFNRPNRLYRTSDVVVAMAVGRSAISRIFPTVLVGLVADYLLNNKRSVSNFMFELEALKLSDRSVGSLNITNTELETFNRQQKNSDGTGIVVAKDLEKEKSYIYFAKVVVQSVLGGKKVNTPFSDTDLMNKFLENRRIQGTRLSVLEKDGASVVIGDLMITYKNPVTSKAHLSFRKVELPNPQADSTYDRIIAELRATQVRSKTVEKEQGKGGCAIQ